ncbi:MAG TPA: uracil-DNA glycosylase [Coriobacteriia bacterium]|nr:uracil-DNA glycosylase [Coriobacteriia bacterium]
MRDDEARVVAAFCAWLAARGWEVSTEVDFCDLMAVREGRTLYAEAKGRTAAIGLDVDTMYGQILRRMPVAAGRTTRFGVVVPTEARIAALRVPEAVRAALRIDVYVVDASGEVEEIIAVRTSRPRPIVNKLAYDRGELLSREHSADVLSARQARTYDGSIGRLNRWVDTVRARTGESVPYFDPAAASDGARVLILLQDPSQEADAGSGFISRHNNDPTARNICLASDEAGLPYDVTLHWNVVPWWVANPDRQPAHRRRTLREEAIQARPYLAEMMQQLTVEPAVIILAGKEAQDSWDALTDGGTIDVSHEAQVLRCPHPSPLVYPKPHPEGGTNGNAIIKILRQAAARAEK